MKINSLFSLFGSKDSKNDLQSQPNETAENFEAIVHESTAHESTASEFIAAPEEFSTNGDSNEVLFEVEELDNLVNDLPLNSHQLHEFGQDEVKEFEPSSQDRTDDNSFYIDESDPNSLLDLGYC